MLTLENVIERILSMNIHDEKDYDQKLKQRNRTQSNMLLSTEGNEGRGRSVNMTRRVGKSVFYELSEEDKSNIA